MVWTLVEPGVAIVASSLVTIRPLLRQMRLKGFESSERSRSRGLWGARSREGHSTGGGGGGGGFSGNNYHNNGGGVLGMNSSKMGQWSQVPSDNNSESLKLKDLEAGFSHFSAGKRGGKRGVVSKGSNGLSSSGEMTLSSRTSTQTNSLGSKWGGGSGVTAGITLREDHHHHYYPRGKETETLNSKAGSGADGGVGIAVTTNKDGEEIISPVSVSSSSTTFRPGGQHHHQQVKQQLQHAAAGPASDSSSESVLIIEGVQQQQQRTGGGNAPTTWRDERPLSLEESEGIQGLRFPRSVARRAGGDDGE